MCEHVSPQGVIVKLIKTEKQGDGISVSMCFGPWGPRMKNRGQ